MTPRPVAPAENYHQSTIEPDRRRGTPEDSYGTAPCPAWHLRNTADNRPPAVSSRRRKQVFILPWHKSKTGWAGGSYTTISRHLRPLMARSTSTQHAAEIPADLAETGRRAVLSIYTAIQNAANVRIGILEKDAARISHAERASRLRADWWARF